MLEWLFKVVKKIQLSGWTSNKLKPSDSGTTGTADALVLLHMFSICKKVNYHPHRENMRWLSMYGYNQHIWKCGRKIRAKSGQRDRKW